MNRIVCGTVTPGQGLYMELLRHELSKHRLNIPLTAHDIINELEGKPSSANVKAMIYNES